MDSKIPVKQLKNGCTIPVLGLGTWLMGGNKVRNPENDDNADIIGIKTALEMGITHIDTAENYAEGHAEELVGLATAGFERKNLFLASKVDPSHLHTDDLLKALQQSLERLHTDYLDLYMIHAPNDTVPLAESINALNTAADKKLVRHIGVSNFTAERLKGAQKYTSHPIVVNQVYYNVKTREPETDGLLSYCQQNDIFLEAYRPLNKGALETKSISLLAQLAEKYKKTTTQIALNWLTSQTNIIILVKMTKPNHIQENIGATGWEMSSDDIELARAQFPDQTSRSDQHPLL
jgi:diketogulonate reductase-like aldo/keto reductase